MAEGNLEEEYTVLNVEIELISTIADTYVNAAKEREIEESEIIAKILEVVANNDGMINALLDDDGGWNDPSDE